MLFGLIKKKSGDNSNVGKAIQFYDDLNVRGGVKSFVNTSAQGVEVIKYSAGSIAAEFKKVTDVPKSESFESACARFGITESKLPYIHNQLVLQTYISFFVSIIAFTTLMSFCISGSLMLTKLAALGVGLACLGNSIQSSLQAMRIRRRELGLMQFWLTSPGEWFGSKINGSHSIDLGSSVGDRKIAIKCASKSNSSFVISFAFLILSLAFYLFNNDESMNGLALVGMSFGFLFLSTAIKFSIMVMEYKLSRTCGLLEWILSPEFYFSSSSNMNSVKNIV